MNFAFLPFLWYSVIKQRKAAYEYDNENGTGEKNETIYGNASVFIGAGGIVLPAASGYGQHGHRAAAVFGDYACGVLFLRADLRNPPAFWQLCVCAAGPVSYTHLTLPTIYSV